MTQSAQATIDAEAGDPRMARLSRRERIGFGLGDAGFNFYWAIIGSYLVFFYTDVFGLTAAAAATMVTVTRLIDALTDPLIGAIADRTNSRWGKFRPYLLWGALPMMAAAVLTLSTPDLNDTGKLIWAYATYSAMMLAYTVLNMPYNSLSAVLTAHPQERNKLNSTRFFFAYLTGILVGAATPDLAEYFGGGDRYSARGWQMTMALYATIATGLFVVTFLSTRERIAPAPTQARSNPLQDLKDLLLCRPWLVLFALALVFMVTMTLRGSSAAYYFRYFVERPDLLGSYVGLQMAGLMVGALAAAPLARHVDKRRLLLALMVVVGVLSFAFTFVPRPQATGVFELASNDPVILEADALLGQSASTGDQHRWLRHERVFWIIRDRVVVETDGPTLQIEQGRGQVYSVIRTHADGSESDSATLPVELIWIFTLNILISIALGFKPPITWAMYADVADYNEWRNGRRATAMTFAATTFSQKMGSAGGAALMLSVLAAMGYQANQMQAGASLDSIVYMQTFVPGIFALLTAVSLLFYDLDASRLATIQEQLGERSRKAALPAGAPGTEAPRTPQA